MELSDETTSEQGPKATRSKELSTEVPPRPASPQGSITQYIDELVGSPKVRNAIEAFVAAGLDVQLLGVHLMQIEGAMKLPREPFDWLEKTLRRARRLVKQLEHDAAELELIDLQYLFDPSVFIRQTFANNPESLDAWSAINGKFRELPRLMRLRSGLLATQVKRIGGWRRSWLRGNFALIESVGLLVAYVGDEMKERLRNRWRLTADVLNAIASKNQMGMSFTPEQLAKLYRRRSGVNDSLKV